MFIITLSLKLIFLRLKMQTLKLVLFKISKEIRQY